MTVDSSTHINTMIRKLDVSKIETSVIQGSQCKSTFPVDEGGVVVEPEDGWWRVAVWWRTGEGGGSTRYYRLITGRLQKCVVQIYEDRWDMRKIKIRDLF